MRNLPAWAYSVLMVVGVVMVGSMALPWIDLGFGSTSWLSTNGLAIAWHDNHWLFVVPASGALLAAAAAKRSAHTRLAAVIAGLAVAGDVVFEIANDLLHMTAGSWLVVGGAVIVLLGVPTSRRVLRVIGGVAMIVGFFIAGGIHTEAMSLTGSGIAVDGLLAIACGCTANPKARWGALVAGSAVFVVMLLGLGLLAYAVFGLGAWSAFGASVVAMALAIAVPAKAATPARA